MKFKKEKFSAGGNFVKRFAQSRHREKRRPRFYDWVNSGDFGNLGNSS
jgi:hypothetical protein